jgi:HupE / UreJ protein
MRIFLVVCFALTSPAFAHTDVGSTSGFIHGLSHPINGIDHILAMVAVGTHTPPSCGQIRACPCMTHPAPTFSSLPSCTACLPTVSMTGTSRSMPDFANPDDAYKGNGDQNCFAGARS